VAFRVRAPVVAGIGCKPKYDFEKRSWTARKRVRICKGSYLADFDEFLSVGEFNGQFAPGKPPLLERAVHVTCRINI
jgi:hypothetical protein